MQSLKVHLSTLPGVENAQLIKLEGDFDGAAKEQLVQLQAAIDNSPLNNLVVFDFSNLDYLNSFALSQLVNWHNRITQKEGKVVIVGTNDHVRDIFTVLGVDSIFKTYSSLDEAKEDRYGSRATA